jgi:predicted RNA binding protein YcfA (HicA-like mRNA interferase family)
LTRLPRLSGRDLCGILERHGFRILRRRGSHIVLQRRGTDATLTVVVPDHKELAGGTLRSILRQARLGRSVLDE